MIMRSIPVPLGGQLGHQLRGRDRRRAAVGVPHARQQARDLLAVQAGGEQLLDADDPVHRVLRVVAVAAVRSVGGEQALLLVVPQRPLTDARAPGELADAHHTSAP
ncbi:hypothetical protein GCM10018954_088480 [Kutzneria kofuensis]